MVQCIYALGTSEEASMDRLKVPSTLVRAQDAHKKRSEVYGTLFELAHSKAEKP